MHVSDFQEPFPGKYDVIEGEVQPTELETAVRLRIPPKTIEPWQVHYAPFKELIIIEKGELYVRSQLAVEPYSKGNKIRIQEYHPHRIVNAGNEDAIAVVETSPKPYRKDLEPEFPDLNACLRALNKRLMSNAVKA